MYTVIANVYCGSSLCYRSMSSVMLPIARHTPLPPPSPVDGGGLESVCLLHRLTAPVLLSTDGDPFVMNSSLARE